MPLNPEAVGTRSEPVDISWTARDCVIYALGVGAGADELEFATSDTASRPQKVLPTFAVVAGTGGGRGGGMGSQAGIFSKLGSFNFAMLVHGEQGVELFDSIPVAGSARVMTEVTGLYDKGSGAVVTMESTAVDAQSERPLWKTTSSIFIRGEGGWGGDRGPSGPRNVPPGRSPDHQVTYQTSSNQALWYRLSGDTNPLHSDPEFARLGGFERPILHGLCTYGFTGRALLHTLCGSDPGRFRAMEARFSKPVMPGDELTVSIWEEAGGAVFRTSTSDGSVVIDQGRCVVG